MSYILFTPIPIDNELALPFQVWRYVVKWGLQTYGVPVYLLGPKGTRADYAAFVENDNKSDMVEESKYKLVAGAAVVVGVPCPYQYWAYRIKVPVVTLYPEHIDPRKYFPTDGDKLGRCVYNKNQIQIPSILSGIRQLIGRL